VVDGAEEDLVAGPQLESVGEDVEAFRRVVRDGQVVHAAVQECCSLGASLLGQFAPDTTPNVERRVGLAELEIASMCLHYRTRCRSDRGVVQIVEVGGEHVLIAQAPDRRQAVGLERELRHRRRERGPESLCTRQDRGPDGAACEELEKPPAAGNVSVIRVLFRSAV